MNDSDISAESQTTEKFEQISEIIQGFKFDLTALGRWLKENKFDTVALELPEGVKAQGVRLADFLESEFSVSTIISAEPCFGACYTGSELANQPIQAIIHIGHSEIPNCPKPKIPIKYFELWSTTNPSKLLIESSNLERLKTTLPPPTTIGLVMSVQFVNYLDEILDLLGKEGYKVLVGTGDQRIAHRGQVLGCNFSAARDVQDKADCILFIGDGVFHPIGISLATDKQVLAFDPINNNFQELDKLKETLMRQRSSAIASAQGCQNFGIIVSTRPGQNRLPYAQKLDEMLRKHQLRCTLITLPLITPNQLDYLPFDGYVNTTCPRLTIDDYTRYKKPMITPVELEIVLGERDWSDYVFDEIY
jgi:2-(3-amino-3-carboxypropyl)histidine synthase